MTEMEREFRTAWVLITPAQDVAGWVAHCLNLDIVTHGESLEHAFQMATEAVAVCVMDDIEHGLDPFGRQQAPEECWQPLYSIVRHGVPLSAIPEEKRDHVCVAAQLNIRVPKFELHKDSVRERLEKVTKTLKRLKHDAEELSLRQHQGHGDDDDMIDFSQLAMLAALQHLRGPGSSRNPVC